MVLRSSFNSFFHSPRVSCPSRGLFLSREQMEAAFFPCPNVLCQSVLFLCFGRSANDTLGGEILHIDFHWNFDFFASLVHQRNETLPLRLEIAGFIVIYLFFSLGLIMMSIYYRFLHPRFKEARFSFSAPLKSELADRDPNKGTDENQDQIIKLWI